MHELLRHLADAGFHGAPRFLGVDERGREILSFIPGEVTVHDPPEGLHSDRALVAAARLLRRFHDATVPFAGSNPDGWRFQVGAPTAGPVICHNDLGPHNSVYRSGRPIAFIDWDLAAPAPREWDIAYALWRFVPLYDDAACTRLGWPLVPRGPRIALFLDAYGLDAYGLHDRADILMAIQRRQEVTRVTLATWAAAGEPAFVGLVGEGRLDEIAADTAFLQRSRDEWAAHLR